MRSVDTRDQIASHTIKVSKGEDGLYTATLVGSKLTPFRAASERAATEGMSQRADEAIRKSELGGMGDQS